MISCGMLIRKIGKNEVRRQIKDSKILLAEKLNKKHVLFITKKKAISSIQSDFELGQFEQVEQFYQRLHKRQPENLEVIIGLGELCQSLNQNKKRKKKNLIREATEVKRIGVLVCHIVTEDLEKVQSQLSVEELGELRINSKTKPL